MTVRPSYDAEGERRVEGVDLYISLLHSAPLHELEVEKRLLVNGPRESTNRTVGVDFEKRWANRSASVDEGVLKYPSKFGSP